ncbi:MAG: hypothetical protein HC867_05355 [Bacteroidia bacterium]|nr:hypothetical protein [Bacteroidia bacterium]
MWNHKAALWIRGRKNIFQKLESGVAGSKASVWIHCSSLGEFEQGRPVMEKIKSRFPDSVISADVFFPSGYEIRKDYPGADHVLYLPMDSKKNDKKNFLTLLIPRWSFL